MKHSQKTWMTGEVLTWFLMSDLYETFTDTSDGCSLLSDTISRSIRKVHVLLESRKRLGGHVKHWHGSWCQINIQSSFHWILPSIWHHNQVYQEWQCLPKLQEERRIGGFWTCILMKLIGASGQPQKSLDMVPDVRSWWNLLQTRQKFFSNH